MRTSPNRPTVRRAAASVGLITAVGVLAGPVAHADEEPPGNKGTVKVHEVGTPDDDRRNEPKLCDFRIVGFGFPEDADLEIAIEGHGGPNAGPGTFDGTVTAAELSDAGDWAIDGPTLPDGMYKLEVENTTAPGGPKQKVFKIDCPEAAGGAEVGGSETGDTDVLGSGVTTGGGAPAVVPVTEASVGGGAVVAPAAGASVLGARIERPTFIPATAPETQVLGAQVERGALARTGIELRAALLVAAGLMVGGAALLGARRRLLSA